MGGHIHKTAERTSEASESIGAAGVSPTTGRNKLHDAIQGLVADVNGIIFALDALEKTVHPRLKETSENLNSFFQQHKSEIQIKKTETGYEMKMPRAQSTDLMEAFKSRVTVETGQKTLMSALVLALVSNWDKFIGRVVYAILESRPSIIDGSNKSITLSELKEFVSLEEARQHLIDAEIESIIRDNHTEHLRYIEKKLSVILKPRQEAWHTFFELMERRNLLAHTGGTVSRSYLKNCVGYGITLSAKQKLGATLEIDRSYLITACDCITEVGVELAHVIWRKTMLEEQKIAEGNYHEITYGLIRDGRYAVAIQLLTFSLAPPMKYTTVSSRLVDIVNLAQAYKWSGDEVTALTVIESEDWSAASEKFSLAVAVLRDDFKRAATVMEKMGGKGDIERGDYYSWPLFMKFRESKEFAEVYEKVYGKLTDIKDISATQIGSEVSTARNKAAARKRVPKTPIEA